MSSRRDSKKNCTEKSKEFKKFWNWKSIASCSLCDLRAKFKDEPIRIMHNELFSRTTTPFLISFIGTNVCVGPAVLGFDCSVAIIFTYQFYCRMLRGRFA